MAGWGYDEKVTKRWFRSPRQVIVCEPDTLPVMTCEIVEIVELADGRRFLHNVQDVVIDMAKLSDADQASAMTTLAFFTDIIGRTAAEVITSYVANPPQE